jgi:hypothetical protein
MATRTVSRRSSTSRSAKGKGKRSASGSRAGAKRGPARTPSPWERHREEASRQLRGHGPDAAAVALLVVGVLTALGLAGDAAGSVGRALGSVSGALFGVARYAVPVVCIGVAVLFFWWRPGGDVPLAAVEAADDDDGDAPMAEPEPAAPMRVAAGLVLLAIADTSVRSSARRSCPSQATSVPP